MMGKIQYASDLLLEFPANYDARLLKYFLPKHLGRAIAYFDVHITVIL